MTLSDYMVKLEHWCSLEPRMVRVEFGLRDEPEIMITDRVNFVSIYVQVGDKLPTTQEMKEAKILDKMQELKKLTGEV